MKAGGDTQEYLSLREREMLYFLIEELVRELLLINESGTRIRHYIWMSNSQLYVAYPKEFNLVKNKSWV